jgi:hypothetical protein
VALVPSLQGGLYASLTQVHEYIIVRSGWKNNSYTYMCVNDYSMYRVRLIRYNSNSWIWRNDYSMCVNDYSMYIKKLNINLSIRVSMKNLFYKYNSRLKTHQLKKINIFLWSFFTASWTRSYNSARIWFYREDDILCV